MKKNQNFRNYSLKQKNNPFLKMLVCFCAIKGSFSFDIFQYLKVENQKLQIIYANIRV